MYCITLYEFFCEEVPYNAMRNEKDLHINIILSKEYNLNMEAVLMDDLIFHFFYRMKLSCLSGETNIIHSADKKMTYCCLSSCDD